CGVPRPPEHPANLAPRDSLHQRVKKKPPLRLWRVFVNSEIFVEVKSYNLCPFDPFGFDQLIEEPAMRRRRSEDADGSASLGGKAAHLHCNRRRGDLERLLAG